MFILNCVNNVRVPEDCVARLHQWDRRECIDQNAVILRIDSECPARLGAAEIVFGYIILKGAQKHVNHGISDGDELQGAVAFALLGQRCPTLEGPKHGADCRRGDFASIRPPRRIERIIGAPVAREDMAVDVAEILV